MFEQARAAIASLERVARGLDPACLEGSAAAELVQLAGHGKRVCAAIETLAAGRPTAAPGAPKGIAAPRTGPGSAPGFDAGLRTVLRAPPGWCRASSAAEAAGCAGRLCEDCPKPGTTPAVLLRNSRGAEPRHLLLISRGNERGGPNVADDHTGGRSRR